MKTYTLIFHSGRVLEVPADRTLSVSNGSGAPVMKRPSEISPGVHIDDFGVLITMDSEEGQ